ncbi:Phosphatidylethanolamine-binding protein PEBP [Cynara cardunculus var. scolymus]|uniref:Phosphatidylethanolamine-binding protein PEBP n=1 Tax=Cynara cardunculus var. scolymus TaxID=59895 RepID=A0A103XQ21_CYNCS|nr:Phosphatidylethanolamine-binding protein PEBP [Cynara cardunculus var. scolymus]
MSTENSWVWFFVDCRYHVVVTCQMAAASRACLELFITRVNNPQNPIHLRHFYITILIKHYSTKLSVEDIDAPDPNDPIVPWTLWVVINIPPTLKGLPEGFSGREEGKGDDYANIKEGNNDFKVPGWRGPKMPSPGHRFEFKLYALDDEIDLGNKVTKDKLLDTIDGHVLGEAVLTAIY